MHTYTGVPASTGIVVGPVEQIDHGTTGLHRIVCDPFRERALYDVAVVLAKDELRRLSQRAKGPDADILLFQIALLEDESFTNEIGDYIAAGAGADLIINLIFHNIPAFQACIGIRSMVFDALTASGGKSFARRIASMVVPQLLATSQSACS